MTRSHQPLLAYLATFVAVSLLTSCSLAGGPQTSASASLAPTPSATPFASPSVAPVGSGSATAVTGTIYPETPNPNASPTPTAPATPFPTAQPPGVADAIYIVIEELGRPDWCDPDFYPIAHADEVTLARQHLAEMQADAALYAAILQHNGYAAGQQLSDAEVVTVYQDWKVLTMAIVLTPVAGGYAFDYVALRGPDGQQSDFHVAGTVGLDGHVTTSMNEPTTPPNCPICLARGTLIDALQGPVAVERMTDGTLVWTLDEFGARIVAPVIELGSMPVPPSHQMVHLVLVDGRSLDASPGHPLSDGRLVGSLRPGDPIDGSWVLSSARVPYSGGATFDLLPSGATGDYWANGILIGSTLARH